MSSDGAGSKRPARTRPARRGPRDNTAEGKKVRVRVPVSRPYHHGDLRAALLQATDQLIRERGLGEVSLREVARRAQVSHGAPAHHFGNKAGLVTAFAAQGFDRLVQAITDLPAYRQASDGPGELAGTGKGYIRFALVNPAHFSIMFDAAAVAGDSPDYRQASARAYALLTRAIDRCVAEGRLPAQQAQPATVASWSLVHGFVGLWIAGRLGRRTGTAPALKLADATVDLFVARLVGRGG